MVELSCLAIFHACWHTVSVGLVDTDCMTPPEEDKEALAWSGRLSFADFNLHPFVETSK